MLNLLGVSFRVRRVLKVEIKAMTLADFAVVRRVIRLIMGITFELLVAFVKVNLISELPSFCENSNQACAGILGRFLRERRQEFEINIPGQTKLKLHLVSHNDLDLRLDSEISRDVSHGC